ncbi:hypothetical protein HGA88_01115 [Candidatus Roizmanbacteria bacterium]|nr:hypothetical protein [Candidatus Roizmanbacteria bacterium]
METDRRPHLSEISSDAHDIIIQQVIDTKHFTHELFLEVDALVGKKVVKGSPFSQDIVELSELTGISPLSRNLLFESLLSSSDGTYKARNGAFLSQCAGYLQNTYPVPDKTIEIQIRKLLNSNKELSPLFTQFIENNVFFGSTIALLCTDCAEGLHNVGNTTEKPVLGWYLDMINSSNTLLKKVDVFFCSLQDKISDKNILLPSFLTDWQKDINLQIFETVSIATAMAIHARKEENCAVLFSHILFNVNRADFELRKQQINKLKANDPAAPNLFDTYSSGVFDFNERQRPNDQILAIPMYMSMYDIKDFLTQYTMFWDQLTKGTSTDFGISINSNSDHSRIQIKNAAVIICRPEQTEKGQARIKIETTGPSGICIRIDKERSTLGLDFVGAEFAQALTLAIDFQEQEKRGKVLMAYNSMINDKGELKNGGKYFSLFRSAPSKTFIKGSDTITVGEKIACIAAMTMSMGRSAGIRDTDSFSYHSRGAISKSEYFDNFGQIVKEFIALFS